MEAIAKYAFALWIALGLVATSASLYWYNKNGITKLIAIMAFATGVLVVLTPILMDVFSLKPNDNLYLNYLVLWVILLLSTYAVERDVLRRLWHR